MTLLNTRSWLRMSELDDCDHKIGHRIAGTQERRRFTSNMALKMGSALEPVINQEMEEHGALIFFGGSAQIEIQVVDDGDFLISGHPDGFIALDPQRVDNWLRYNFPKEAQERLDRGELMLWEVKTMRNEDWQIFSRQGLAASPFLSKYIGQVQRYLGALNGPAGDNVLIDAFDPISNERKSEAFSFREWCREMGYSYPTSALLVGFNTATKHFAFEVIQLDFEPIERGIDKARRMLNILDNEYLPEPTLDGRAQECYFCPYAYVCPMVKQAVAEEMSDESALMEVPMSISQDVIDRTEELATIYVEANEEIARLEAAKKEAREELERLIDETGAERLVSDRYSVKFSEVKGRRTIDQNTLKLLLDSVGLDIPYRTGNGFVRPYIKRLYGPSYESKGDDNG